MQLPGLCTLHSLWWAICNFWGCAIFCMMWIQRRQPFLQNKSEIHICIRYSWQAKSLTKIWYLKPQLGSSCYGGERCLVPALLTESPSGGAALSAASPTATKQTQALPEVTLSHVSHKKEWLQITKSETWPSPFRTSNLMGKLQPTSGIILTFFPWTMTGVSEGWSL